MVDKKPQRLAKEAEVARLQELFANSQATILTDYRGLSVAQDVKLRAKMREAGIEYNVAKNTLLKLACNNTGQDALDPYFAGPTAVAFADDPVSLARILSEFIEETKKTKIKAGLLEGKFLSPDEVDALAKLPTREVLLAQVAATFASPMSSFAGVGAAMLRQLVTVVDKVREQKEQA